MLENINYSDKIKNLKENVNSITNTTAPSNEIVSPMKFKILYVYISFPIVIFILLLIARPKFLTSQITNNKTYFIENKINMIKVLFFDIIICSLCFVCYKFIIKKKLFTCF